MAKTVSEQTSEILPSDAMSAATAAHMRHLADDMYNKIAVYLQGQIESTIAEYKLLEDMNDVTCQRYDDMKHVANGVAEKLSLLNSRYEILRPYLHQIDEIDENTRNLEDAANTLDRYVTALESKFRELQHNSTNSPS
ncbi:unnamed protein product [Thelazia callipaeda]|uniref:Biogenesis of lysosome-related organelles complex 1 subunit 2 n=1 Tax=Thelazia callipaeda TaxID=103827 RepID=A0A0N5CU65_THECL|nr:unnamed protein product [Thelazia callipaeda]